MGAAKVAFFVGIAILFYSYIGYGIILWIWIKIRNSFNAPVRPITANEADLPNVTLIVAAYNEAAFIRSKIENSLSLAYPDQKLQIIFISDGSTDETAAIIGSYPAIQHLHDPQRAGKIVAMHRALEFARNEIIVFSDANTLLNERALINIARHYADPKVGGVAGEKKVLSADSDGAAGSGEGLYWKYESFLKKLDSELYSVVGAAGELFSIRKELYEYPGDGVLLDDFVISLRICQKGFRVVYEPDAYAAESPSSSIKEEQKRKVRISAGGFQSMRMLSPLLNIFKYGVLSFEYISHRVLRWTLCPLFLPIILILNIVLVIKGAGLFYTLCLAGQILFYLSGLVGWILSKTKKKISFFYAIYYFIFMNLSLFAGFYRYLKGNQTVLWEKAQRVGLSASN